MTTNRSTVRWAAAAVALASIVGIAPPAPRAAAADDSARGVPSPHPPAADGPASVPSAIPAPRPPAWPLVAEAAGMLEGLSPEDAGRIGLCGSDGCWVVTTPLGAETADLLARQGRAVVLARAAAALPVTVPPDAGPTPRPPASRPVTRPGGGDDERWSYPVSRLAESIPRLSALLVLHARHESRDGRPAAAVDDLLAAMALARHASAERTMTAKLVEIAAYRPAAEALAACLPALPRGVAATLTDRLAALPPSPTHAEMVRGEFAFAKRSAARQGFVVAVMVGGLEGFYTAMADGGALPPAEYRRLAERQVAAHSLNPWAKVIGPALGRTRETTAVFEAKQAMLATAVDVVLNGEAAVAKSKDPFGDGPFTCRKLAAGFELAGHLTHNAEPVKLTVGR
jgi:hypothetical protein